MTGRQRPSHAAIGGQGWLLHPHGALRAAGFPFECWSRLIPPELSGALADLDRRWAQAEEIRAGLLTGGFAAALAHLDPAGRRRTSKLRAAVGRRRPADPTGLAYEPLASALDDWNTRLAAAQAAADALAAAWDGVLHEVRARLHRTVGDPAVLDAVLLLSPSFRATLEGYALAPLPARPDHRRRAVEQRAVLYLQRLAAKNETNSFFGPVGRVTIDPAAADSLRVDGRPGAGPPVVFTSPRTSEAIAEALAADPALAEHLPVHRSPQYRAAPGGLRHSATNRWLPLTDEEQAVWRGLDTPTPLAHEPAVRRLLDAGALVRTLPLDPWRAEPFDGLQQAVDALPDIAPVRRWQARLAGFRARVAEFAAAEPADRVRALSAVESDFTDLTGRPARRGGGAMYADRGVVFEERRSLAGLTIGGGLAGGLGAELAPALTFWAAAACQRLAATQRTAGLLFDRQWPGREQVPLLVYLSRLAGAPVADEPPTPAELRVADLVAGAQADHPSDAGEVRLPADALTALAGGIDQPLFTSVDLLFDAADRESAAEGRLRLVLGEAHASHLLSVFPTDHFARGDDPTEAADRDGWLMRLLGAGGRRIGWLVTRRTTKIFQYRQPAVAAQLRAYLPAGLAVPPADLVVRRHPGGVALHDRHGPLTLLPPVRRRSEGFDPIAPLCLPAVENVACGGGPVRPRVLVGRTILQRAQWRCAVPADLVRLSGARRLLAARAWRREAGLPELLFARVPGEPKPVLVDLRNPVSVDAFAGMLRRDVDGRGSGGDPVVTVAEMLPDPSGLWLGDGRGRYTAECRILAALPAATTVP